MEAVVAGERDNHTKGDSISVEDLYSRAAPHARRLQHAQVGREIEDDAVFSAVQQDTAHQERRDQEIREGGGEVHDLKVYTLIIHLKPPITDFSS